jgi:hypothetical protein
MRPFVQLTLQHFLVVLFVAGFSGLAFAGTIVRVPADQPKIQAGINAAVNGDTVLVSPGTYYENINFSGKNITVISASGPGVTTIDGQQTGPSVTFASGETLNAVLSGFTVRNGNPNVSISNASATIRGNVIGGTAAFYVDGIDIYSGGAVIQSNLIVGNGNAIYTNSDTGVKILGNAVVRNNNL